MTISFADFEVTQMHAEGGKRHLLGRADNSRSGRADSFVLHTPGWASCPGSFISQPFLNKSEQEPQNVSAARFPRR